MRIRTLWLGAVLAAFACSPALAQNVQGTVTDAAGAALVGVNVVVDGTTTGTTTGRDGAFALDVDFSAGPQTLVFSFIGYDTERRTLSAPQRGLRVAMREGMLRAADVIVSASRVEERVLETPITVERISARQLEMMPATETISLLERFKGIDVSRSGLTMSSLSTRGFNSAKAERLIQMVDYVDFQSPSLSLYSGNMGGVDEIDVASIDVIYGANSALYGANAFNGVVLFNTKDPFAFPGASARVKGGTRDYVDAALRLAHAPTPRLGLKFVGSYMQADDFIAQNYDVLTTIAGNVERVENGQFVFRSADDPRGYDAVNRYGSVDIGPNLRATQVAPGVTLGTLGLQGAVFTPGFAEVDLVRDYRAGGWRLNPSVYYRLTDDVQVRYDLRATRVNGLYQSSNRYVFDNISQTFHALSAEGPTWNARAYASLDDAGDTYDMGFLGAFMNRQPYRPGGEPTALEAALFAGDQAQGRTRNYAEMYAAVYGTAFAQARGTGASVEDALRAAQAAAARVFPAGDDPRLTESRTATLGITTPGQSPSFQTASQIYHAEAQARQTVQAFDFTFGGSYRAFRLSSNGTLYRDGPNSPLGESERSFIPNWEAGAYLQVQRALLGDRVRLAGVGRVDAYQNFDPQFSPRLSAVYVMGDQRQHNIRASLAQAHRSPAQLDQYIFLDIGQILLLANVDDGFNGLDIAQTLAFFGGQAQAPPTPFTISPLRQERVTSWEVGYKGIVFENFYADVSYYRSRYNDFIGTRRFIGREDGSAPSLQEFAALQQGGGPAPGSPEFRNRSRVMQVWLNADQVVTSQGVQVGFEYYLARPLAVMANYTWSDLEEVDDLILGFNTPRHKFNVGAMGEPIANVSYSANLRWTDAYEYQMPFAEGTINSFTTLDAQVAYAIPRFNARLALGGTNLLDAANVSAYGAAPIGRMLYTSLTVTR